MTLLSLLGHHPSGQREEHHIITVQSLSPGSILDFDGWVAVGRQFSFVVFGEHRLVIVRVICLARCPFRGALASESRLLGQFVSVPIDISGLPTSLSPNLG